MFVAYYILPILILYKFYNFFRVELKSMEAENELLKIRNSLHASVKSGLITLKDPSYLLLEMNISTSITLLKKINFWTLLYIMYKHKNDPGLTELRQLKINPNTISIDNYFNQYAKVVTTFFEEKSRYSLLFFKLVLKACRGVEKLFGQNKRNEMISHLKGKIEFILVNPNIYNFTFATA